MSTDTDSIAALIVTKSRLQAAKAYAQKHYDSWGSKVIDLMTDAALSESILACKDLWEWARMMKADFSQSAETLSSAERDLPPNRDNESPAMPDNDSTPSEERAWRTHPRPQNIRVGKYFMLSDFLYSEEAATRGIKNVPPSFDGMEVESIRGLCAAILDPLVDEFGAVSITYGYVSPELHQATYPWMLKTIHNCQAAKKVKGARLCACADVIVHSREDDPRSVLHWVKSNCQYDRLILFPCSSIVCVGWADKPRSEAMEWVFDEAGKKQYVKLQ